MVKYFQSKKVENEFEEIITQKLQTKFPQARIQNKEESRLQA